jgi:hypothetical protein
MTSPLHQLTMTYSPEQDRVMLRIGTKENTEYQLWMTRRFVRIMWRALIQIMERDLNLAKDWVPEDRVTEDRVPKDQVPKDRAPKDRAPKDQVPEVKDAIMAMQHQESVQNSDFSQKHAKGNVNLMANTGALLVIGCQVKPVNEDRTRINFKTDKGTGIEFFLNKKLLHALCHMIIKSAQRAQWDLDLAVGDPNVMVPADAAQIH